MPFLMKQESLSVFPLIYWTQLNLWTGTNSANQPLVTDIYILRKNNRKILNYNNVLNIYIYSDETADSLTCDCQSSPYKNNHHNHIVTGDMHFVEDKNLRKLLNKGIRFRLPQPRNAGKALKSFKNGIDEYVKSLSKKFKLPETVFDN